VSSTLTPAVTHLGPALRTRSRCAAPSAVALLALTFALTGCHHNPPQVAYQPPPATTTPSHRNEPPANPDGTPAGIATAPPGFYDDTSGPPVYTEEGLASWYGPNYNHHNAADGTVYDQDGMTAAHRTLPLGTTVRVTNLQTGQQILVRITDRGPFAPGRILDLSMGAAKAVGLYRIGVGKVRVEAFAHVSADPPGRWCVQTGPFTAERDALDLKNALIDRYRGAKVSEFQGPTGFWVRIDPADHAKDDAVEIQDWIGNPDPQAAPYLVRID
jgi:rare lipoprotein A